MLVNSFEIVQLSSCTNLQILSHIMQPLDFKSFISCWQSIALTLEQKWWLYFQRRLEPYALT